MICDQCGKKTSEAWNRDFILNKPFSKRGNIMICKKCAAQARNNYFCEQIYSKLKKHPIKREKKQCQKPN